MERIGRELGVEPDFRQGQWEYLLQVLGRGEVDVVVNGYELTAARSRDYLATRPYYVYQLQLMARRDGPVRSWADFELPATRRRPLEGRRPGDVGRRHLRPAVRRGATSGSSVFDGATNAMTGRPQRPDRRHAPGPPRRPALHQAARVPRRARARRPARRVAAITSSTPARTTSRLRDAIDRGHRPADRLGRAPSDLREVRHLERRPGGPRRSEAPPAADRPGPPAPGFDLGLLRRFGPSLLWRP